MRQLVRTSLMASAGLAALLAAPALAQTPADAPPRAEAAEEPVAVADNSGEVIVTARRRNETSIATPVAITAVSGAELERRNISTIDSLARVVPTLVTSEATSSPQGGIVALRGLSGVDGNPFGDQAVSFNIDGVQVARSSVRRLSQMDIAQIEVLKGPQALFFGKNSPAGIIAIRTGDPTKTLTGMISTGYEFKADETRTEGFIAGPLTETLGFRLAGYYDHMKGYVTNIVPAVGSAPGIFPQFDRRAPNGSEYAGRLTLKWDPSDRVDARLKIAYSNIDGSGSTDNLQHLSCPLAQPQTSFNPVENCRPDGKTSVTDNIGPNFGLADARFGNGETFLKSDQWLAGLEVNAELTDQLKFSSITGFYDAGNSYIGNFTANYRDTGAIPRTFLPAYAKLGIREWSQEVRLTSSFEGMFNFMVGAFAQDSRADVEAVVYFNANAPTFSSNYMYRQDGTAYSFFGQALIKPTDQLELSVGGRYSYERKTLPVWKSARAAAPSTLLDVEGVRRISFNDFSPEATLTYRPTQRLTFFGGYKEGFLSGGFNSTQPVVGAPNAAGRLPSLINPTYGQQRIRGLEGGIKTALFNNTLRLNYTLYNYKTLGLQVATLVGLQQELRNAGAVRTRGVEFDFNYRTPLEGLTLNGAISYEDGHYIDYQATCYRGLATPRCRNQLNRQTGATGLLHDLSGTQLVRAPEWTGNIGFDYLSQPFSGIRFGLNANASFSDSFFTDVVSAPGGRQKAYELYDAGARIVAENNRWELAFIGRNLGNTYYFTRSADNPFTGSAPGGTGTILGDTVGVPSRGRELWVKATFRFN